MAKDKPDAPPPEALAAEWPLVQYRDWVQSQVARRVLMQFGTVTAAAAIAIIIGFVSFIRSERQLIEADLKEAVTAQVGSVLEETFAQEFRDDARSVVVETLLDQNALVESIKTRAQQRMIEDIDDIVQLEGFVNAAANAVGEELGRRGTLQEIILDLAEQQLLNGDGADGRRLGLQLYALFYYGVRADVEAPSVRDVIAGLLSKDDELDKLSPLFFEEALGQYRMDLETWPAPERRYCSKTPVECQNDDHRVLSFVLRHRHHPVVRDANVNVLQRYFSRLPPWLVVTALDHAMGAPDEELSFFIVNGVVQSEDTRTVQRALVHLTAELNGNPSRRDLALEGLARLDRDLIIAAKTRQDALNRLWRSMSLSDRARLFSADALIAHIGGGETDDGGDSFDLLQTRRAILALLRAGEHRLPGEDGTAPLVGLPQGAWTDFRDSIGRENTLDARIAMAMRLHDEGQRGVDVSHVAEAMIGQLVTESETNDPDVVKAVLSDNRVLLSPLLRHASPESIAPFANLYISRLRESGAAPTEESILFGRALLASLTRARAQSEWLESQFDQIDGSGADAVMLEDHLLRVLAAEMDVDTNGAAAMPLLGLVLRESVARAPDDPDARALVSPLLGRLTRMARSEDDTAFWQAAMIAEEAAVLSMDTAALSGLAETRLRTLRELFAWPGTPVQMSHVIGNDAAAAGELTSTSRAGGWLHLSVDAPTVVDLTLGAAREVVFFDRDRHEALLRRRPAVGDDRVLVVLPAGEYATHFRRAKDEAIAYSFSVARFLPDNDRENPTPLPMGPGLVEIGATEGSLWLSASLARGQTVTVETKPDPSLADSTDLDTVVEIYRRDNVVYEAMHDDIDVNRENLLSRLIFEAPQSDEYLIHIREYGGGFFAGTRFVVDARIE